MRIRDASPSMTAWLVLCGVLLSTALANAESGTSDAGSGTSDDGMTLRGDQEGTVLQSLTVEGENQVQVEFERPELVLDVDASAAPGLVWDKTHEVLEGEGIDLEQPLVSRSAFNRSPYLGRPWLNELNEGPVARFKPKMERVDRWRLLVADSRGQTVATFDGKGNPPKEITWDGTTQDGSAASPGLTYSYVFEAYDQAGNKRNFIGDSFEIPAYRYKNADGFALLFQGDDIWGNANQPQSSLPPAIVLEAASWLNQLSRPDQPLRLTTRAKSFEQAKGLADRVQAMLAPLVIGDPLRFQVVTEVQPGALRAGTVEISTVP